MAQFEGYERREAKILGVLKNYGISSIDECKDICAKYGVDPYTTVQETQPICFENAKWAYTVGSAIAFKEAERTGDKSAATAAANIGIGLQSFCIPGSVAENRKVGLGHGNLGKMLLSEETECFCFLAGHESFAAAEGAIKIALNANKVRVKPLRVILNGLGKDAAYIISRINGFTYVETEFDPYAEEVKVVYEKPFSKGARAAVKCYGADNVPEGVLPCFFFFPLVLLMKITQPLKKPSPTTAWIPHNSQETKTKLLIKTACSFHGAFCWRCVSRSYPPPPPLPAPTRQNTIRPSGIWGSFKNPKNGSSVSRGKSLPKPS